MNLGYKMRIGMQKYISVVILSIFVSAFGIQAQKSGCDIENQTFQAGEKISYEISYNWVIPWVKVGEASFQVKEATYGNNRFYHIIAKGRSYDSWDWFYEVKDIYQSWVDPVTIKPYYFKRDVNEDNFQINIEYEFNRKDTLAYTEHEDSKKPKTFDTVSTTPCTYDIISILYYARNLDYSGYKKGDKFPVTILLDNEMTDIYFRYLGKDQIRLRKFGKIRCLKFSVYTVEGHVFEEGENMQLWVTDDRNKIPVKVKTPIIVGSVKGKLKGVEGLKHPFDAKID